MPSRSLLWLALAVTVLAAAVRYPRLADGLWLDEMTTLVRYVQQPWAAVLSAGPGDYLPNNHVLHTVLCKLIYPASAVDGAPREPMLRLPAWAAGSLLPVAVAWPLRRRVWVATAVAVVLAVHPWLVALGADARGYTLMLLLGVVATNGLATPGRRGLIGYAVALAAAIYTVPLAVLLVPAHAAAVLATRRPWRRWIVGAAIGVALAVVLYLPMARGIVTYYRHPFPPTATMAGFLDSLPRHALAGERLPRRVADPLLPAGPRVPDPTGSAVFWAVPVLAVVVGSAIGWRRVEARPLLMTLGTVTVLGAALPLLSPSAAEVRFVTSAAVWVSLAIVLLLAAAADTGTTFGRVVAALGLAVTVGQFAVWDANRLPNQPVREAVRWADAHAPPGRAIVVLYLGSIETVDCYAGEAGRHGVLAAPTGEQFARVLAGTAGRPPWVVILFEELARDREPTAIWRPLADHYDRVLRLPGRLTPVAVYAPREPARPMGVATNATP